MQEETKDKAVSPEKETAPLAEEAKEKKPLGTLLGSISYDDEGAWQSFLDNLTIQHSVIVLITSANYAQSKGVFNLAEAELIAKAIKRLKAEEPKGTDAPEPDPGPDLESN